MRTVDGVEGKSKNRPSLACGISTNDDSGKHMWQTKAYTCDKGQYGKGLNMW